MQVQFGLSSYERGRGDLPELPVVNMYAEEAPTEEKGVVLQSRPGLSDRSADMGNGPVQQLFKRDNVLSTALFGVSDGKLWKGTTSLGAIDGGGPFSMAGYEDFLFAAGGAGLWGYDDSSLAEITLPDNFDAIKCIVAASRVIVIRKDTQQYYFSDPLESDIEALDFTSAENQPDRLRDCLFIDAILILFGAETIEFHASTGDSDLPFRPIQARVIEKGIRGTGCATAIGSTFAWVTNENQVCLGDENTILSNPGLQARIEASTNVLLFAFVLDGVEFLALRLDEETQVYNTRSGTWSEFATKGLTNWAAQCFAGGVFGSAEDGKTLEWGSGHTDALATNTVLERRFRGGFPINSDGVTINNVHLRCNVGQTPFLSGDYIEPKVEMRLSRTAGRTWGDWRSASLGEQGQYRARPQWRGCGQASQPAFLAEWRVTAPVDFRVSDVLANESWGGR